MITREVMVPRTDMITLLASETYDDAMKLFIRSGFSRIPVLGESADEVVGIAYFKDLVEECYLKKASFDTTITAITRKALFVPESKPIDDLFRTMQQERQHIALVIDEYGGIAGLVTLEDALEEIVGELDDEHDIATDDIEVVRDELNNVLSCVLPGRFAISDLEDLFAVEIEHDDVDTVLGLLNREIGRVAIKGSHVNYNGLEIEAIATSGRRKQVSKIRVTRQEVQQ
jgi:CBS domain containing-hemolysin-like protein